MRILMIGGTGLISSSITRDLVARGDDVVHYNRGKKAEEQVKGPRGYEVGYELFGINGKMPDKASRSGSGKGNVYCSTCSTLAPGKSAALLCQAMYSVIVALDGNPVPRPADVAVPLAWNR